MIRSPRSSPAGRWARPLVLLGRHPRCLSTWRTAWLGGDALVLQDVPGAARPPGTCRRCSWPWCHRPDPAHWRGAAITARRMDVPFGPLAHRRPAESPRRALPRRPRARAGAPSTRPVCGARGVVAGPMGVRR
ncbi:hypothetical protein HBB16_02815 [Pseudonocardia sp. MCCB 268]|nr:hypothetical protein [Pseudonocardia cytotoxica]